MEEYPPVVAREIADMVAWSENLQNGSAFEVDGPPLLTGEHFSHRVEHVSATTQDLNIPIDRWAGGPGRHPKSNLAAYEGTLYVTDQRVILWRGKDLPPYGEWEWSQFEWAHILRPTIGVALFPPESSIYALVLGNRWGANVTPPPHRLVMLDWLKIEGTYYHHLGLLDAWMDALPDRLTAYWAHFPHLTDLDLPQLQEVNSPIGRGLPFRPGVSLSPFWASTDRHQTNRGLEDISELLESSPGGLARGFGRLVSASLWLMGLSALIVPHQNLSADLTNILPGIVCIWIGKTAWSGIQGTQKPWFPFHSASYEVEFPQPFAYGAGFACALSCILEFLIYGGINLSRGDTLRTFFDLVLVVVLAGFAWINFRELSKVLRHREEQQRIARSHRSARNRRDPSERKREVMDAPRNSPTTHDVLP